MANAAFVGANTVKGRAFECVDQAGGDHGFDQDASPAGFAR